MTGWTPQIVIGQVKTLAFCFDEMGFVVIDHTISQHFINGVDQGFAI